MRQSLSTQKVFSNLTSILAPKYTGLKAAQLIQTVGFKTIRRREKSFYTRAKKFTVPFHPENLNCYELGNSNGDLVFLLHGWESNAGSMSFIANELAENGFRVILMDLPAHAHSELEKSNLRIFKNAFLALINHLEPYKEFSIVAHSLGALIATYALANTTYKTNRIVFISCVNKYTQVIKSFKHSTNLGNNAYKQLCIIMQNIIGDTLDKISIEYMGKLLKYDEMLLVHDKNDCTEPFDNSKTVSKSLFDTTLLEVKETGHLLILWNKETARKITSFIKKGVRKTLDDTIPEYENLEDFERLSKQINSNPYK